MAAPIFASLYMMETMDQWLQFLARQGARLAPEPAAGANGAGYAGPFPDVLGFAADHGTAAVAGGNFVAPLANLGLIAASGEEAAHFLHNQLTNDVLHLGAGEARLAGYCSPKGRLLATLLVWKTADAILLQLPREILAPLQKRLQMFILRAKVKLADVSDQQAILGLAGAEAGRVLANWFDSVPAAPYALVQSSAGTLIRLADAEHAPRYQWLATPQAAREAWSTLAAHLTPAGAPLWRLTDIQAGVPQITQATQEQFVPQMINYEVIGGVNFEKGCYPGQEIVARSQYLGKLKRRMQRASVASLAAQAGMEVFSSADPDQPCGRIVNAERGAAQRMDCLVELKTAALAQGSIHLGAASGAVLEIGALPYALPVSS